MALAVLPKLVRAARLGSKPKAFIFTKPCVAWANPNGVSLAKSLIQAISRAAAALLPVTVIRLEFSTSNSRCTETSLPMVSAALNPPIMLVSAFMPAAATLAWRSMAVRFLVTPSICWLTSCPPSMASFNLMSFAMG